MREIWQWIENRDHDRTNADSVTAEIVKAIQSIAEVPGIGHSRKDVRHAGYLFKNAFSCLVAYKYDDTTVTIMRDVHSARDVKNLF